MNKMVDRSHFENYVDRIKPRAASNVLLWAILVFFVAAVVWAALTELDRTVHAAGRVIPSDRLQIVSNLEGGVVREILVVPGDLVKKGQPLILLAQVQAGAELGSSEASVGALDAKVARLVAEVRGTKPVYPAPRNAAEARQIAIETSLHASRMADLSALSAAADARIEQARRAVAEAQATYESRITARDSAQAQLRIIRPLVEKGIEPQLTLLQLESSASVAASDAAAAQAAIARAQGGVVEATSQLAQLRQNWRSLAATELAAAQGEREARERVLPALADRLGRTTVTAPLDGKVNRVLISTIGGSVSPGQPLVEVVPSDKRLLIEALVSPKDIAAISIGQAAKVNLSAYDSAIYGSMDGKVLTISPDATQDERTGESHYIVKVEVDQDSLRDTTGKPLPIGPGMTADVNLIGEKRSVLAYIFTPITRLSQTALRE
ncbi:HlyD family type I secretion periplasmic adaptor subunit [Sandarakinorhabdus sp.]|uniref:HlyD family type I secretion periplasmic adaptor subunit n=1 Tax=Sandarakinorhabdus sp. TaxID=1916663 RepID=UPI003F6EE309